MLTEKEEEMLEAVWTSGETKDFSIDCVRKRCVVPFDDHDVAQLERGGMLVRAGDKILFTREGKAQAEGVIRRHRLAEVLFASILKLKDAEMEELACKVEHCLLPEVEQAICTLLGHPEVCPDGTPIPRGRCCTDGIQKIGRVVVSLRELRSGESGKITYIKPGCHTSLHQLIALGLHPGVNVVVLRRMPVLCLRIGNTELALDDAIANDIFVWRMRQEEPCVTAEAE